MSSVISPVSDLVGAVDTIVGRLQERAKSEDAKLREREDLHDALLDLLHLLRQWERCANATNDLASRVRADDTVEDPAELREAVLSQSAAANTTLERFGSPRPTDAMSRSPREASGSISDVLFVYVPEVEEQLTRAMHERRDALEDLERVLEEVSPDPSGIKHAVARLLGRPAKTLQFPVAEPDREQLGRTHAALRAAAERLAWFIRKTYDDAGQNRVRAPH